MNRVKCWCWTLNNYTASQVEYLEDLNERATYIVFGKEIGESGTPHLQGYIEMKSKIQMKSLKKYLQAPTLHLERRKGTSKQASDYCKGLSQDKTKNEYIYERGSISNQGSRNDIALVLADVKDGMSDTDLQEKYPMEYVRYYKAIDRVRRNNKQQTNRELMSLAIKGLSLLDWQQEVLSLILNQDDRIVLWVCDVQGGKGKTTLAKYLISEHSAFYVSNGRNADISFAYNLEPLVIFDYTRSLEDYVNYGIIEQFKNGLLFSSKYESQTKIFPSCKVVCFANFSPDRTKLSEDRWKVIDL